MFGPRMSACEDRGGVRSDGYPDLVIGGGEWLHAKKTYLRICL